MAIDSGLCIVDTEYFTMGIYLDTAIYLKLMTPNIAHITLLPSLLFSEFGSNPWQRFLTPRKVLGVTQRRRLVIIARDYPVKPWFGN